MQLKMIFYQHSLLLKFLRMNLVFSMLNIDCSIIDNSFEYYIYRDETYRENVLEKQADLIRYLHERNEQLTRLVLRYKQQMDIHSGTGNHHL